jgi:hypothetical protein
MEREQRESLDLDPVDSLFSFSSPDLRMGWGNWDRIWMDRRGKVLFVIERDVGLVEMKMVWKVIRMD